MDNKITAPAIYYLGHSAWAVETVKYFLLFDIQNANVRTGGTWADGAVDLASLTHKPVYIFYSHRHHDHYSPALHRDSQNYAHVYTILGDFTAPYTANTLTLRPHETRMVGDITIHTGASTDEGVCYLLEVNGTNIFFAGDNADWGDGDESNRLYYQEINYLAANRLPIDIAFVPVCTYSGQRPADMTKGAIYAVNTLKPALTYPMHANGREHLYTAFERDLRAAGSDAGVVCAYKMGRTDDIGM